MGITLERIKPLHPDFTPDPSWEMVGMTPSGNQLFRSTTPMVRAIPDIDPKTEERRHRLHPTTAEPLYAMNKAEHFDQIRTFYLISEGNGNIIKVDYTVPTDEELAALKRGEAIETMVPELAGQLVDMDMTALEFGQALKMISKAMKGEVPDMAEEPVPAVDGVETPQSVDTRPVPDPDVAEAPPPPPDVERPVVLTKAQAKKSVQDDGGIFEPLADLPPKTLTYPRHVAGGKWELSDGSIIGPGKGLKHEATVAEAALHDPVPA